MRTEISTQPAVTTTGDRDARILVFKGPGEIDFITRPLPAPGATEILVQTMYSAISHGTEMNVYRGLAPQWQRYFDGKLRLLRPVTDEQRAAIPARGYWTAGDLVWGYPMAYGYANVGRVVAVGDDVTSLRDGDLVYAYEPHQSAYVAPAQTLLKLPHLANPATGVLLANLNTAYGGVLDANIRIDDTVVVFGQGLIGLLVTQFLRNSGARQVITVERFPARREMSLRMGASRCLDPATDDVALTVRELTGGRGADVVIEASGAYPALQEAIRTAAPNTTVVALSWYGGQPNGLALSDEFHHNRITIKSSQVGGIAPDLSATHSTVRRARQIVERLPDLDLEPLLTDFIPHADAARAYDLIDRHGNQTIQVVLTYGE